MHAYTWQEGWCVQHCEARVEEDDEGGGYDEWDMRAVVGMHL